MEKDGTTRIYFSYQDISVREVYPASGPEITGAGVREVLDRADYFGLCLQDRRDIVARDEWIFTRIEQKQTKSMYVDNLPRGPELYASLTKFLDRKSESKGSTIVIY